MLQVGTYRLIAPLLRQDVARYEAIDTATGIRAEVRLIGPNYGTEEALQDLYERLATVSLADSPNIRRIQSLGWDTKPRFVALQWLDGTKLVDRQASQPLVGLEAIQLVEQLASALPSLHRVGFVHSAICPENVQQGDDRWIIDCAYPIDPARRQPSVSDFRAPEAEHGEPEPASDVFSVAKILVWLLFPTDVDTQREARFDSERLAQRLTSNNALKPIAFALAPLLSEALAIDPLERPAVAEFEAQLHTCAQRLAGVSAVTVPGLDRTVEMTRDGSSRERSHQTVAERSDSIQPGDDPWPTQLGRFRITAKLGEGGMGAVYRGEDLASGSVVAIKVLGKSVVDHPQSRRRFAKEARMLARTQSPYVANLLEYNVDEGTDYLVTEFLPGSNLGEVLKETNSLSEETALALMVDAARGLAVAHNRGIVHRDIKPDNLLLTEEGVQAIHQGVPKKGVLQPLVKVADFGLARSLDQSESLAITRQGAVMGTPFYMAPEQCRGEAADARSDVYSMGATLFHLLAGRPPYVANTHVAVLNKHNHDPIPSLAKFKPGIAGGLERVVEKSLAKNPDARYENAGALLVDLENLLHGKATSLVLHPVIPDRCAEHALEYEFIWTLTSSAAQLWPLVANTDRLNQAMGLPPARFSTRKDPERGVRRFAETRIAGQRIAWEEHPFEWIEGRRMSVLREFSRGPFNWFVNVVELTPQADGGTILSHKVILAPRNLLGRVIAKLEIGVRARRSLARIYQQIDGYVAGSKHQDPTADAFRRSMTLGSRRRTRLQQRINRLRDRGLDAAVIDTLGQFLEYASDQEVARIRPRAFAERFGLDPGNVLAACLVAAKEGLLVLLWDILCPSCRIPANVEESLTALKNHGHCEACDVDFELDFANSIEMIFRAHPEIREVEVQTYCIGGPAFSAHVVSQVRVASQERFEMELALPEGTYRLRGPQLPFVIDLRVSPTGNSTRCDIGLSSPIGRDRLPVLRTGSQLVTLVNDGPVELLVRLERTASRHNAVTAADASALPLFRELLPGQVLSPGQIVSVATVTIWMAQLDRGSELYEKIGDGAAFDVIRQSLLALENCVTQHGGAVVKVVAEGMFATFADPRSAVDAGLAAQKALALPQSEHSLAVRAAIHRGPAMVTTLNDRLDYFGSTVHLTTRLLELSRAKELVVTEDVIDNAETGQLLAAACKSAEVVPVDWCQAVVHRYHC